MMSSYRESSSRYGREPCPLGRGSPCTAHLFWELSWGSGIENPGALSHLDAFGPERLEFDPAQPPCSGLDDVADLLRLVAEQCRSEGVGRDVVGAGDDGVPARDVGQVA